MDQLKPSPPNSSHLKPLCFLERAATIYADGPSIIYNSTPYKWSETYQRYLKIVSSLLSLGIRRGDVVLVVASNVPELHFAILIAGVVLNTNNLRLDSRTVSIVLRHAQSKLVFVDYQSDLEAISLFPPNLERSIIGEGHTRGTKNEKDGWAHLIHMAGLGLLRKENGLRLKNLSL